jgi:repressor LexA
MDFGLILKDLRIKNNITQIELAKCLGVSRSAISLYELGLREPYYKFLRAVADYFDVSMDYLLDKDRSDIKQSASNSEIDIISVPIVGRVPAGIPAIPIEEIEDYFPLPASLVHKDDCVFGLKIKGDSMTDIGIDNGDIVLVKKRETAENGQTVIALIDGEEVTCKRFYKLEKKICLEPANSKYKALSPQNVEIIGIVFKVIKDIY